MRDGTNKDEANVNWSAWQNNNLHGRYFILGSTYVSDTVSFLENWRIIYDIL